MKEIYFPPRNLRTVDQVVEQLITAGTRNRNSKRWILEDREVWYLSIFDIFSAISGHLTVPSYHIFIKNTRCRLTWSSWKIHVWWRKYWWFVKIKNNKVTKEEKKNIKIISKAHQVLFNRSLSLVCVDLWCSV